MISQIVSRRAALVGGAAAVGALGFSRSAWSAAPGARIVALGGAATEILYALGCGDRVVAVDVTSRYPAATRGKPNVGYYRSLSAEGVLALNPDLIVATDGAGPKEAMDVLTAASVKLVSLQEVHSAADIGARIRAVGEAVGEAERGAALAGAVETDLKTLQDGFARLPKRRKAIVLLGPPRGGGLMAAGAGSTGDLALTLAGAENAASGMTGWKPLTDEAAYGMEPDAIVALATSGPLSAGDVARSPGLAGSPAVKQGRVVVADALGFIGFGPRAAHAALGVAKSIYPEEHFADLPARAWVDEAQAK